MYFTHLGGFEMYETFMRHAKKITDSKIIQREVLKGVKHFEDGSLAVTDSHRLYLLKDAHGLGKDTLLSPAGKKIEGAYPNIERLLPTNPGSSITVDVNELFKGIDIIHVGAKIIDGDYCMNWKGKELSYYPLDENLVSATYELPFELPTEYTLSSNVKYWFEALQLFKAFRYPEVEINFHGKLRPFTVSSLDGKLTALILPIRRY